MLRGNFLEDLSDDRCESFCSQLRLLRIYPINCLQNKSSMLINKQAQADKLFLEIRLNGKQLIQVSGEETFTLALGLLNK